MPLSLGSNGGYHGSLVSPKPVVTTDAFRSTRGTLDVVQIKIHPTTKDMLDELGEHMQQRMPHIWSSRPPYNAIVGYAAARTLFILGERNILGEFDEVDQERKP